MSRPTPTRLDLEPVGGTFGARIDGLALADLADDATAEALADALADHLVLFLPGLAPAPADLVELGRRFGELEIHPYLDKVDPDVPEVCLLDTSTTPKADVWHTDVTFSPEPPIASILHMVDCPPAGGDTMWIDLRAAHDSLSPALASFLATLTCEHHSSQGSIRAEHPVVRTHPVTGRRVLYVNRQFSRRIPQLTRPESQMLLAHLYRWIEQVRFSVRWRWQPGDVAIWDNRATLHAMVDDTDERRLLHRVTVLGDEPIAAGDVDTHPRVERRAAASSDFFGIGGYEF